MYLRKPTGNDVRRDEATKQKRRGGSGSVGEVECESEYGWRWTYRFFRFHAAAGATGHKTMTERGDATRESSGAGEDAGQKGGEEKTEKWKMEMRSTAIAG